MGRLHLLFGAEWSGSNHVLPVRLGPLTMALWWRWLPWSSVAWMRNMYGFSVFGFICLFACFWCSLSIVSLHASRVDIVYMFCAVNLVAWMRSVISVWDHCCVVSGCWYVGVSVGVRWLSPGGSAVSLRAGVGWLAWFLCVVYASSMLSSCAACLACL